MGNLSAEKIEKYREELEFLEKATWDQFKDYIYPLLEDLDDKDAGYIEYLEGLPHMMIEDLFFTFRLVYDIPGKGNHDSRITGRKQCDIRRTKEGSF